MSIRTKAMLYTAAYVAGGFSVGVVFTLVSELIGVEYALGAIALFMFGYLSKVVYSIEYSELEREQNK